MLDASTEYGIYDPSTFKKDARDNNRGGGGDRGGARTRHDRKGAVTLFVGNLPFSLGEEQLAALFAEHGEVASASIICDSETGRPRGFGFVDFVDEAAGKAAEAAKNGFVVDGRDLVVNVSEDKFGGGRGGRGGGRGDRGGRGRGRGGDRGSRGRGGWGNSY